MATDFFGVKKGLNVKPGTLPVTGDLGDLAFDSATNNFKQWNGATWAAVAGTAGIPNLITGGDAESTNPFVLYKDAAAVRPVDGTGGSPTTVSSSVSSSSPILGLQSFILTKSAANGQGEGWSIPLDTVLPAYKAKVLNISFDYMVNSGTFVAGTSTADSDVIVYLYDVTNSQLIEPSSIKLLSNSTTLVDRFSGSFQTSATGTSYRLIFHVTSSLSNAFSLKVDNISVSPSQYVYGTPITDWSDYTMTGSWTANATYTCKRRRVGDTYEYHGFVQTSALPTPAVALTLTLTDTIGGGFIGGNANNDTLGVCSILDTGVQNYEGVIAYNSATSVQVLVCNAASTYLNRGSVTPTVPHTFGSTDTIYFKFSAPIAGLSSSVQTSDQTDTRVIALSARRTAATTAIASGSYVSTPYDIVDKDSHGAYNSSTGVWTCPVSGWYYVDAVLCFAGGVAGGFRGVMIDKNSAATYNEIQYRLEPWGAGNTPTVRASAIKYYNQGDTLKVHALQNSGSAVTLSGDGNATREQTLSIQRVSGPNQIAANEFVGCKYFNNAGTSMPNSTVTVVDFSTKDHDTHGAVTTGASWKFTAPTTGTYSVAAIVLLNASTTWAVTEAMQLSLYKNNAFDSLLDYENDMASGSNINRAMKGSTNIRLNAGDYIDIRFQQTSGGAITLASSGYCHVSINRLGF